MCYCINWHNESIMAEEHEALFTCKTVFIVESPQRGTCHDSFPPHTLWVSGKQVMQNL